MALSRFIPSVSKQDHKKLSADFIMLGAESAMAKTPDFSHLINKFRTPYFTHGHQGQRRSGTGADFWQYKEYQDGDNSQNIDWRKSAKGDTHYIREREWEKAQTIAIWVSRSRMMQFAHKSDPYSKAQYAAILAYILSAKFMAAGEHIKFINAQIKSLHSAAQLPHFAHSLAEHCGKTIPHNKSDVGQVKSFPILISDFWEDLASVEKQIKQLSANNFRGLVIQVTSPAELSLPYKGRVILEPTSADSAENFTISKIEDVKKEYTQRIETHQREIMHITNQYGCQYIHLSTARDPIDATMDIYRSLAGLAPEATPNASNTEAER